MDKFDAMLFGLAKAEDLAVEKAEVWAAISIKRAQRAKVRRCALLAASLTAAFGIGLLAGTAFRSAPAAPGTGITLPVVMEVPATSASLTYEYLDDVQLASVPGGDIEDMLPAWVPEGFSKPEPDSPLSWHCENGSGEWIHAAIGEGDGLMAEMKAGLNEGFVRSRVIYEGDSDSSAAIQWLLRTADEKYLSMTTSAMGISYEDGLRILQSIPA